MFAQNPKKDFTIAYDLDSIKKAVHTIIEKEPAKYTLVNDDIILNQIRLHEKGVLFDLGYHVDFTFKKISETETNVAVEVSRNAGAINTAIEVQTSNLILKGITDKFSSYLSGKVDAQTGKAVVPGSSGCMLVFIIIFVVAVGLYLL